MKLEEIVGPDNEAAACDFISERTGISKRKIKQAMIKGAVWITKGHRTRERLRTATARLSPGDRIEVYYDETILSSEPPKAVCLYDEKRYTVWYKPPGLLTQGTMYGDHCSLLRQAETAFSPRRPVFPVHRLDREAAGLVVIAHTKDAASKLSQLLRTNSIEKVYRIEVLGDMTAKEPQGSITAPLDGREARTDYLVEGYDPDTNVTTLSVTIETGRLHQIRRHFNMIGHPVMGDPRYGKGNKNREGLKIAATAVRFVSPFSGRTVCLELNGTKPALKTAK